MVPRRAGWDRRLSRSLPPALLEQISELEAIVNEFGGDNQLLHAKL